MNDKTAIKVENLTKIYFIFDDKKDRLKEALSLTRKKYHHDFYALNDVSFEIKKGETFGIIGVNGSGKSTLLKILTKVLNQSSGTVEVEGKVSALLELGAGFNSEMTGIENIYLNGTILGYTKKEMDERVQSILEFADIGEFVHQPVKMYSSGMYVRLAFAVAINVDPDILIIDEALAVGDIFFRQKCYAKLEEFKQRGKTIVLVTHGMNEVEQFCDRAIMLEHGKVIAIGNSQEVVKKYYLAVQGVQLKDKYSSVNNSTDNIKTNDLLSFNDWSIKENVFFDLNLSKEISNGKARFLKIGLFDVNGMVVRTFEQGQEAYFYYEIEMIEDIQVPLWGTILFDGRNTIVHGKDNLQMYTDTPLKVEKGAVLHILQTMQLDIQQGEYTFEVGFATMEEKHYLNRSNVSWQELDSKLEKICIRNAVGSFVIGSQKIPNPTQLINHGVCDLQNKMQIIVV